MGVEEQENPVPLPAASIAVTEITEEPQAAPTWRRENLSVQIPSDTMESPTPEARMDIPSSPTPTPEKAISVACSPGEGNTQVSPGPSSRGKSESNTDYSLSQILLAACLGLFFCT